MNNYNNNVAIVRSTYSPFGGVETHTVNLIKALIENNIKITLLTLPKQDWPMSYPSLNIVKIGKIRKNRLLQAVIFNRSIERHLLQNKYRCVLSMDQVSHCTHFHAGGGSHRAFLEIKNQDSMLLSRMFRKISMFHAYILNVEKKLYSSPYLKKVRCCSHMVKNDILKHYNVKESKLALIYNSIEWEKIGDYFLKREKIARELYQKHNLSPDKTYLLFLGSGFLRKGLDIAITGMACLPEKYHLIVVGKDKIGHYKQLASDMGVLNRIHYIGPREQGWIYSTICKAMVLPSRYEPFGRAAAEGQAMGLPVLVSDKNGYSELITEENGVMLNSPFNTENTCRAFNQLISLIEKPRITPDQVRNYINFLDDKIITNQLINDFIGDK